MFQAEIAQKDANGLFGILFHSLPLSSTPSFTKKHTSPEHDLKDRIHRVAQKSGPTGGGGLGGFEVKTVIEAAGLNKRKYPEPGRFWGGTAPLRSGGVGEWVAKREVHKKMGIDHMIK